VTPQQALSAALRAIADAIEAGALAPAAPVEDRMLPLPEVAQRLGITVRTAQEWARSGRLPVSRLGTQRGVRVREADLAAWMRQQRRPHRIQMDARRTA
jgi:excisionase family DNA binding protein